MKRFQQNRARVLAPVRVAILVASALVVGCASDDHSDLRAEITRLKKVPAKEIPPLPVFETYETYTYSSAGMRDPFSEAVGAAAQPTPVAYSKYRPDPTRNKEALESFPLDGLQFVGTLEKKGQVWAIIKAPDKFVHSIKVGNHLGQNEGKVIRISETEVEIEEIIPDGLGGWIKQDATLALQE